MILRYHMAQNGMNEIRCRRFQYFKASECPQLPERDHGRQRGRLLVDQAEEGGEETPSNRAGAVGLRLQRMMAFACIA